MKKLPALTSLLGAVAIAALLTRPADAQTPLPNDVLGSCAVSATEFDSWKSGTQGVFNAADSATFNDATDCNFFKWGAQMFLWLTSQVDGTHVFDGADFLDVVKDGDVRNYVASTDTGVGVFAPRTEKTDDDAGVGQTGGGGVLIGPDDGIVYYGVKVNDLYAYYQAGVTSSAFNGELATNFPDSVSDMNVVVDYATTVFGVDGIDNSQALAMEMKTSWIEASLLPNDGEGYVTVEATVSTWDKDNGSFWLQTGTEVKTLALVGFHVVGSVNGHPEMVWATFEHVNNAPQNGYFYFNATGAPTYQSYDGNGSDPWLFNASPDQGSLPVTEVIERATFKAIRYPVNDQITIDLNFVIADEGQSIGPNEVVRINPWGDVYMTDADAVEPTYGSTSTPTTRATDLVSLNQSIINQLAADDVRRNYIQTGSIWSGGGPNQIPTSGTDQVLRGTLRLANSTMETFHQFPDSTGTGSFRPENCFGCHSVATNSSPSQGVSHIFSSLIPLQPQN